MNYRRVVRIVFPVVGIILNVPGHNELGKEREIG